MYHDFCEVFNKKEAVAKIETVKKSRNSRYIDVLEAVFGLLMHFVLFVLHHCVNVESTFQRNGVKSGGKVVVSSCV